MQKPSRRAYIVLACWIALLPTVLFLVRRPEQDRLVGNPTQPELAMKQFSNDPNYGAVERVYAYIVDAYDWERQAMPPPNPELENELRSHMQSRLSNGSSLADSKVHRMVQERGRALLSSKNDHIQSLQPLADMHWIGDAWMAEVSLLSNPPKHDPKQELIVDLRANDDGSADVTTHTAVEQRVYRVENVGGKWLIRKYDWKPKTQ